MSTRFGFNPSTCIHPRNVPLFCTIYPKTEGQSKAFIQIIESILITNLLKGKYHLKETFYNMIVAIHFSKCCFCRPKQ